MVQKKPNVLQFISPAGMYGAEMWILALAKNLKKMNMECHLAVSHESESQNLELYSRYQDLGLPAYKLKMKGRFDPAIIVKLVGLIKEKKIDIIHTHGYKSDILGLMAARLAGIRAVATPHGFENVKDFKLQLFIKAGCTALKYFDAVVPLSDALFSDMKKIGVPKKKIQLIQNGVDLDEVYTAAGRPCLNADILENSFKKIGYVGQMASRKNITDLIRAFDLLYEEQKEVQLILIGDGPMEKDLQTMAAGLPSSKQIVFLGYRKDRLELLRKINIFAMTSSLEGIPRCMMEAMAMGVPATAFHIPGVDKLIIDKKTGLSAAFGDVKGLAECWKKLLSDGTFSAQIGMNGKEHMVKHFSGYRMAYEYFDLYKKL